MALKKTNQADADKKDPVEPVDQAQEEQTKTAEELAAEAEADRLEQERLAQGKADKEAEEARLEAERQAQEEADKEAERKRLQAEQEAAERDEQARKDAEAQRLADEAAAVEAEEQRLAQEREAAGQDPVEEEFVKVKNVSKNAWRQYSTGMWIDRNETKKLANDGWLRNFLKAGLFQKVD